MAITKEQEKFRKNYIGSSDVYRVMAGDTLRLVLEKLGEVPELEETAAQEEDEDEEVSGEVRLGWKGEAKVLDAYEEKFRPASLIRSPDTAIHPDYPWLAVHADSIAIYANQKINTEGKTVGWYRRHQYGRPGTDQVPARVTWQVQTQMLVLSGAYGERIDVTHVPVWFINEASLRKFILEEVLPIEMYVVPADAELQEMIVQRTFEAWRYIDEFPQTGRLPPPQKLEDALLLYKRDKGLAVEATDEIVEHLIKLVALKALIKQAGTEAKRHKFEIISFMKEASDLLYKGQTIATYRNDRDGEKLDDDSLERDLPETFKKYLKPTIGSRKLLPKPKALERISEYGK